MRKNTTKKKFHNINVKYFNCVKKKSCLPFQITYTTTGLAVID